MFTTISRLLLALTVIFSASFPVLLQAEEKIALKIEEFIKNGFAQRLNFPLHGYKARYLDDLLLSIYKARTFSPYWTNAEGLLPQAHQIKDAIQDSYQDGLVPDHYYLKIINERWLNPDSNSRAELDLYLTLALAKLTSDAQFGRRELRIIDMQSFGANNPPEPQLQQAFDSVVNRSDIYQAIQEQFPRHRQYQRMKVALAEYRLIERNNGWGKILGKEPITAASTGSRVFQLAKRLQITGDLPHSTKTYDYYDLELQVAVKNFQSRHGIQTTGEVHKTTLEALNVPVESRIKTLIVNLERWRWLNRDFGENKEIYVNIAGYELFAIQKGVISLRLPVIVGKAYQATPVFSGLIQYIEFNPYWNVPNSIAATEMLPHLRKNSSYLDKQHMLLFEANGKALKELNPRAIDWSTITPSYMKNYAIKQLPGSWNVLGELKFVFPNPYSVYLHDTANPELFEKRDRAFSHGCIRVKNPRELAEFLLTTPEDVWTAERVKEKIATGKNQNVKLPRPVPVYITYRTAWVDLDKTINFRADIYNRDFSIPE